MSSYVLFSILVFPNLLLEHHHVGLGYNLMAIFNLTIILKTLSPSIDSEILEVKASTYEFEGGCMYRRM